ncbi:MAG: alpha-amylase [bacterium]|nr:alpha-amylase [bacterium]
MKTHPLLERDYFVLDFPVSREAWTRHGIGDLVGALPAADLNASLRQLALHLEETAAGRETPPAEDLLALRTLNQALRWICARYFLVENPGSLARGRRRAADRLGAGAVNGLLHTFVDSFPPAETLFEAKPSDEFMTGAAPGAGPERAVLELLLLFLNAVNPAARPARPLFDDDELRRRAPYVPFVTGLGDDLDHHEPPGSTGVPLLTLLREPMQASPGSLAGQLSYMREHWADLLPDELLEVLQRALDVLAEADARRGGEPGPPPVLEFGPGTAAWGDLGPEPEAFSRDADWMSNVVLMAKSVYVWLDQLGKRFDRPVTTLRDVPDEALDELSRWGVTGLWLIGLWERSTASRTIKQWMGNPDAAASAYALDDYGIAADLGGENAWRDLRDRAWQRGIRLASDMVPNHMGVDSRWVVEHPEYFLQLDQPPYPAYRFTSEDLCGAEGVTVRIEDGYWDHADAAVVFQRVDDRTGETRYIYHGNDGTSTPWNDTAQLNFMLSEVRRAVSDQILRVASMFPIIRFDAAMTLAKKHYQRLWFPAPGDAGAIPSRAEHGLDKASFDEAFPEEFWREVVDRVAAEAPDTLLLAEAFWLMEGYFVRTLGMHRVYNSAFMNMLKMEDNQKYRQTIKNVLEFSPQVLKRFVNFMNNPDERTAVEQFGKGDKYLGCATLLVTMPGLPMLGHGQIEGFTEKYGMEYKRAYWDETADAELVRRHEHEVFPLMRRRALFSGVAHFALYDFTADGGWVEENVFAYSNRHGDERALILFNNSYDATRGRVHVAAAVNEGSADAPHLVRHRLDQALGLSDRDDTWYGLRDHISGLEYLRSGGQLAREGFACELRGYQTVALARIRALGEGPWGKLAGELDGAGCPDLDLAQRRHQLAAPLAELRSWFDQDLLAWLEHGVAADDDDDVIVAALPLPEAAAALPEDLRETYAALGRLPDYEPPADTSPGTLKELVAILADMHHSRAVQAIHLSHVLQRAVGTDGILPADALPLLRMDLESVLRTWLGHEFAAAQTARTAEALAVWHRAVQELAAGRTSWFADFLVDELAVGVLGMNRHDGKLWLVAERLEEWLEVLVLAALADDPDTPLSPLLDGRAVILAAARDAGWRVDGIRGIIDG